MKPFAFFKKHSKAAGKHWQLSDTLLNEIAGTRLPFTSRNYYSFCDKYLDEDAHEALFLDGEEKYFREIAADYDILKYLYYLRAQYRETPVFCDIGCGIGNMVLYSGKMLFRSFGYEINTKLKPVHQKAKVEVLYGDILETDLSRLKDVDVIYLYRPINDAALMNRLLGLLHRHSKPDVTVLYNYPHTRAIKGYQTVLLGRHDDMIALVKQPTR